MHNSLKFVILTAGFYEALCILTVLITSLSLNSNRTPRSVVQSNFFRDPQQISSTMNCDDVSEFEQSVVPISVQTGVLQSYMEYTKDAFVHYPKELNTSIPDALAGVLQCLPPVQTQDSDTIFGNLTQLLDYGCHVNGMPAYGVQYVHQLVTMRSFGLNFTSSPFPPDADFGELTCIVVTHYNIGPNIVTQTCFFQYGYFHFARVEGKYQQWLQVRPSNPSETILQTLDAIITWYTHLETKVLKNGMICRDSVVVNQEYLDSLSFTLDGAIIYLSIASVVLFFISTFGKIKLLRDGYQIVHGGAIFPAMLVPSSMSGKLSALVQEKV